MTGVQTCALPIYYFKADKENKSLKETFDFPDVPGCIFAFFSDSAPTKGSLGAINGMAQTIACTMRMFAPLTASSLFSASHQYNLLDGNLVYCVILAIIMVGIYMSSKLPSQLRLEQK